MAGSGAGRGRAGTRAPWALTTCAYRRRQGSHVQAVPHVGAPSGRGRGVDRAGSAIAADVTTIVRCPGCRRRTALARCPSTVTTDAAVAGAVNSPVVPNGNSTSATSVSSVQPPADGGAAEARLDRGVGPVNAAARLRSEEHVPVARACPVGRDARHVPIHPVHHGAIGVVVEAQHVREARIRKANRGDHRARVDRAVGTDRIPSFPDGRASLANLVEPRRRLPAEEHQVALVDVTELHERGQHERRAQEPCRNASARGADKGRQRRGDAAAIIVGCHAQLQCHSATGLRFEGMARPAVPGRGGNLSAKRAVALGTLTGLPGLPLHRPRAGHCA